MKYRNGFITFQDVNSRILNKNPDIVPEESPLIILDSKSAICMAKNGEDTNQIRQIDIRVQSVRNGEN